MYLQGRAAERAATILWFGGWRALSRICGQGCRAHAKAWLATSESGSWEWRESVAGGMVEGPKRFLTCLGHSLVGSVPDARSWADG